MRPSSPPTPAPAAPEGAVRAVRALLVLLATAACALPLAAVTSGPLRAVAGAAGHGRDAVLTLPLEQAVAGLCAAGLVSVYAVWVLALLSTLTGAVIGTTMRVPCPRLARTMAGAALGASLGASLVVASPASADPVERPAPGTAGLVGLALPDRVTTPAAAQHVRADARHEVVAGDTLWSVAEAALPAGAPAGLVDRAWRRVAAANTDVVTDPHLIFPGTELRVPPLDDLLGKDLP